MDNWALPLCLQSYVITRKHELCGTQMRRLMTSQRTHRRPCHSMHIFCHKVPCIKYLNLYRLNRNPFSSCELTSFMCTQMKLISYIVWSGQTLPEDASVLFAFVLWKSTAIYMHTMGITDTNHCVSTAIRTTHVNLSASFQLQRLSFHYLTSLFQGASYFLFRYIQVTRQLPLSKSKLAFIILSPSQLRLGLCELYAISTPNLAPMSIAAYQVGGWLCLFT